MKISGQRGLYRLRRFEIGECLLNSFSERTGDFLNVEE